MYDRGGLWCETESCLKNTGITAITLSLHVCIFPIDNANYCTAQTSVTSLTRGYSGELLMTYLAMSCLAQTRVLLSVCASLIAVIRAQIRPDSLHNRAWHAIRLWPASMSHAKHQSDTPPTYVTTPLWLTQAGGFGNFKREQDSGLCSGEMIE